VKQLLFWIVVAAVVLNSATVVLSIVRPDMRVWPPPRRDSWQYVYNGVMSFTGLLGVVALGIIDANSFAAVSCPSASFCMALDQQGDWLAWNGTSWSRPRPTQPLPVLTQPSVRRYHPSGAGVRYRLQFRPGAHHSAVGQRLVRARAVRRGVVVSQAPRCSVRGILGQGSAVLAAPPISRAECNLTCDWSRPRSASLPASRAKSRRGSTARR